MDESLVLNVDCYLGYVIVILDSLEDRPVGLWQHSFWTREVSSFKWVDDMIYNMFLYIFLKCSLLKDFTKSFIFLRG